MTSKAVSIFLWFCLFIVPLSYNFWGLDPALYSKFLLLDIALLVTAIFVYARGDKHITVNRPVIIFTGLYLIYFFASVPGLVIYGVNRTDGLFSLLHIAICPAFVLLLFGLDQISLIKRSEAAMIISSMAAVAILIGSFQYVAEVSANGWSLSSSNSMKATFAHKNIFAEIPLLTLPFSCYSGFTEMKKIHLVIAASTVLVLVVLLSRAAWVGFAVGSIACCLIYVITRKNNVFNRCRILSVISVILIVLFMGNWFIEHTATGSKLAHFYNMRNTINEREHLWSATWQIIKLHPLVGSGLGSWKVLNMRYGIVGLRNYSTFFQQPHNDTIWILSEQGLLGLLAVGAAWLYLLYILVRNIWVNPSDTFLYCLLFAMIGYWGYSNFGFPRERPEHGIIMAFVAFFILRSDNRKSIFKIKIHRLALICLCILLAVAAWWAGNKMYCEIQLRHFFEARANSDPDAELTYLNIIKPAYCTLDGTATPIAWYKGMAHFAKNDIDEASIDFDDAVKANPYHAYSLANVGTCLGLKGNNEEAANYFRLSLLYSPGFPEAALNLAAIKFNARQTDSAAYYLGMANDTLTNPRYKQFLIVVMKACITPMIDSAVPEQDSFLLNKYKSILENERWMMHICKEAYIYRRTIPEQVNRDVVWIIGYEDKNPALSEKLKKSLKLDL